ncbi:hypothetical protein A2344_03135 [Candidatus Peregrinibacteria bacterium RIFOXYB12_FULL_41_12]|nr:MAG: hypothetical protein A2244_04520 [Candidatus Peregrinibacteria bacterium RIFOXYA2_FULL_41_18]OGJ49395.1 MAG: hypothetical protein A2344_03135 [Candidatus Peregrinibacteria bacterium RIFOXYB12_FULL_41_12]OGJ53626.1 MAG: hypothetical protein A2448_01680 [Candidatus Peregrinibacteria bacterium RIFOXYC2_FULL_41_22]
MKNLKEKLAHIKVRAAVIMPAVLICVLIPLTAFAATKSASDEAIEKLQTFVNTAFGVVHAIFWPILLLIGSLMDNDLIFGPTVGEKLREIWVVIRNIVNIAFVFVLLVVAFYNVTGLGGEGNFALKSVLPKFVIALIAVNFSFFICKVILDASNIVAMSVYDLTGSYNSETATEIHDEAESTICQNISYQNCIKSSGGSSDSGSSGSDAGVESGESSPLTCTDSDTGSEYKITWETKSAPALSKIFCCDTTDMEDQEEGGEVTQKADTTCTSSAANISSYDSVKSASGTVYPVFNSFGESFFKTVDQNNIGVIMAINLGSLNELTQTAEVGNLTLKQLTINGIFGIVMYLVFGFAYAALFCVLLARVVVLWMVIALSPIIALTTVMPQIGQYASELKLGERFIQHIIAPIVIGLSMSIGYVMINAMKNDKGGIDFGGGDINFDIASSGDVSGQLLTSNVSDIHQLMLAALAVAIVWMGVFGAADKTLAGSITGKIKEAGISAAKFVGTLPKYAPFMPMMTGSKGVEPYSFSDITGILNSIKSAPESRSRSKVSEWAQESGLNDWMRGEGTAEYSKLFDKYKDAERGSKIQGENLKTMLASGEVKATNLGEVVAEMKRTKGLENATIPTDVAGFNRWMETNQSTLRGAYGGTDFTGVQLKPKQSSGSEESATTEGGDEGGGDAKANFTTIFNGSQTATEKVKSAKDQNLVSGGTDQQLEALMTYLAANKGQADTVLKFTADGKQVDVAASTTAMQAAQNPSGGSPAQGSGAPANGTGSTPPPTTPPPAAK